MIASVQKGRCFVGRGFSPLFVLLFAFFVGATFGFFIALFGDNSRALQDYLLDYINSVPDRRADIPLLSVAWECLRWPLLVLFFSFHPLGIIAIPVLFSFRSFLLSHAVFALSFSLPGKGFILSIVLFSATILFILPTMFLWGCEGFHSSLSHRFPGGRYKFRIEAVLIGTGTLLVAIAVQWALIPFILSCVFI